MRFGKHILSFFLFFGLFIAEGQELVKSFPVKLSNKYFDYEIVGKNNLGIIIHHYNSNDHMLELLNENLRSVMKKELSLRDKNVKLEDLVAVNGGVFAFYSQLLNGKQYLKARLVNEYLETSYSAVVLDSLVQSSYDGFNPFYIKSSADNRFIATFSIYDEKGFFAIKFKVYNDTLKLVNSGNFELQGRDYVLKSFKINNNAKVMAVVAHTAKASDVFEYEYDALNIFVSDPFTGITTKSEIAEANVMYKQVITELSSKNNFCNIAACYKTKNNGKDEVGILVAKVEADVTISKIPFTKEQVAQIHNYDFKDWIQQASIIKPKKIIPRSDGGCVLIMEGQYQYTRVVRTVPSNVYYYGDSYMRLYDQNHYFDILTYSLGPDGNLNWQSVSPKVQVTEGDGGLYSSYIMFEANNVVKFLFNEDIYNNGNFIEYNLNPLGNQKRISLFNSDKENLTLIPQKGKQISGNMVLIPSEQKRNLQFVLFKY